MRGRVVKEKEKLEDSTLAETEKNREREFSEVNSICHSSLIMFTYTLLSLSLSLYIVYHSL